MAENDKSQVHSQIADLAQHGMRQDRERDTEKRVLAQLVEWIRHYEFQRIVTRYRGDHKVRRFSCWDQFLCMAFAPLTSTDDRAFERKVPLARGPTGRFLMPALAAVADLDADGKQELVFVSSEQERVSGTDPGRADESETIRCTHNLRLLIRDSRLRPVADHLRAKQVPGVPNVTVRAGPAAEGGSNRILVLGDQVLVFQWASPGGPMAVQIKR